MVVIVRLVGHINLGMSDRRTTGRVAPSGEQTLYLWCAVPIAMVRYRANSVAVSSLLRSSRGSASEAGRTQLAVSLPPEPLTLEGDPIRLTQVLANLLNNAAKYTNAGGQIWLSVRGEGNSVVITVRDNGMGIPPDMLQHIFDLFMQVDRHAGRAHGGLGIGLTLVKSLAELHGGSVTAHSCGLGKGSEFVVRLPLAAGNQLSISQSDSSQAKLLTPRRVLVVDDNRDAAQSLGMLLKLLGAQVQVVFGGPEALEAIAAQPPAVVLLDLGMPGMDGYEVARRIREQPHLNHVTLIALTGWGQGTIRWAVDRLKRDYFSQDPDHVINVWLLKDKSSYEQNTVDIFGQRPHTPFGYYSARHKALVMNIQTGGGTLVHEIVHPLVAANFPECPSWLNEGLGSLYEQCQDRNGHIHGLTNWRLHGLHEALKDEEYKMPTFEELCSTSTREFYEEDRGTNYAQARYLLYYLQEQGLLVKFYREFRRTAEDDPTGYATLCKVLGRNTEEMDAFQKEWTEYVLALRY